MQLFVQQEQKGHVGIFTSTSTFSFVLFQDSNALVSAAVVVAW